MRHEATPQFMSQLEPEYYIETEVSKKAIQYYLEQYDIYKGQYTICGAENEYRNQMKSMQGCYLHHDGIGRIDIVGDVLTGPGTFTYIRKTPETDELLECFEQTYHAGGNFIPTCEGGNLGGPNCDNFTHHLNIYKWAFQSDTDRNILEMVRARIVNSESLGGLGHKTICYWIWTDWVGTGRTWEDFVRENYLIDLVTSNLTPLPFVPGRPLEDQVGPRRNDDEETSYNTLLRAIKLIIQRAYRIEHGLKQPALSKQDRLAIQDCFKIILPESAKDYSIISENS